MKYSISEHLYSKFQSFFHDMFIRASLITTLITGIVTYGYYITNNINNYDNINNTPCMGAGGAQSGRWFLSLLTRLNEKLNLLYNIKFFEFLISIIILALSCIILCRAFNFKRKIYYILFTAVTVSFPAVASTVFFIYTMPYYMLAVFMAAIGFYLVEKSGKLYTYFCFSLLVSFSIGIYQAYYPFIASLAVLSLIKMCFDKKSKPTEIITKSVKYFISIILSYVFYRFFLLISLKCLHTELSDYQGISQMGAIELTNLPSMLKEMYYNYYLLPTHNYHSLSGSLISKLLIIGILILSVIILLLLFKKNKLVKNLEALFLTLILPVSANFITVMVPDGTTYTLMTLGLIVMFYYPIVLMNMLDITKNDLKQSIIFLSGIILIAASANYAYLANGCFVALQYTNIKTENYFNTMFTRIKLLEEYNAEMKILFIGDVISDESFDDSWIDPTFDIGGMHQFNNPDAAMNQMNEYSRDIFIKNYFGYTVEKITDKQLSEYKSVIDEMNQYPNDNSIKIVDGNILVKFEKTE